MSKLSKDEILFEVLRTLVRGWGKSAVAAALDQISNDPSSGPTRQERKRPQREQEKPDAEKFVESLLPLPNQELLLRFAHEFDRGEALPKLGDVKRFLASHHVRVADIKSRNQAFRHIFPLLRRMSEKGLLRAIHGARFSGPVQLDEISDAIKGAGSDMRETG